MTWAFDTEDTGVDFWHGARPFFVSIVDEDDTITSYEWAVDPLTREVSIPEDDVEEIRLRVARLRGWGKFTEEIRERHKVVGQNVSFDVRAMEFIGVTDDWPWAMTHDTLIAAHLLASNQPHNLTDLCTQYLGVEIEPLERSLEAATQEARRMCRSQLPGWSIAKE